MSCYLRHITSVLNESGIILDSSNRKKVDQAVHEAVGVIYKNCPVTWKAIKEDLKTEEKRLAFVKKLRESYRSLKD